MEPRLDIMNNTVAAKVVKYLVSANKAVDSALPAATQELMKIRASQINGCGFCLDMHTKDAAKAGETSVRLSWSPHGGKPRSLPRRSGRRSN